MSIYFHNKALLIAAFIAAAASLRAQVTEAWVTPFAVDTNSQQVYDMALDDSGNVFIVGKTDDPSWQGFDGFVTKLSPGGSVLWWRKFGAYTWQNWFNTVAVDDSGNVYASGVQYDQSTFQSFMSVKYNSSGQLQWADTLPARGGIDNVSPANGEVITLIDNYNITIRKHVGNSLAWEIQNDTSLFSQMLFPFFIGADSSGNIYVAGDRVINSYRRFFVKKFDSAGGFIWNSEFDPSQENDYIEDMKVDKYGNAYLSGRVDGTSGGFAVAKFDPSGGLAWSNIYNPNVAYAKASHLSVDKDGNVYISGLYETSSSSDKCYVIKYDFAGVFQWDVPLDSASWSGSYNNIICDRWGNVYVTYKKDAPTSVFTDYRTCRLSPADGSIVWKIDYNGAFNSADLPVKILVDSAESVIVTGMESGSSVTFATTIKYAQSVGISEPAPAGNIMIYPNPANDGFKIRLDGNQMKEITIYNSLGQPVWKQSHIGEKEIFIRKGELERGIYFIRVSSEDKLYRNKVVIQ
jgi:hypothetical protein